MRKVEKSPAISCIIYCLICTKSRMEMKYTPYSKKGFFFSTNRQHWTTRPILCHETSQECYSLQTGITAKSEKLYNCNILLHHAQGRYNTARQWEHYGLSNTRITNPRWQTAAILEIHKQLHLNWSLRFAPSLVCIGYTRVIQGPKWHFW